VNLEKKKKKKKKKRKGVLLKMDGEGRRSK